MDITELYKRSYVPYSKQPAVALVYSEQGEWFPGVRIENVSYPLSISAVQNALLCCLSEGHQPDILYTDNTDRSMLPCWQKELDITIKTFDPKDPPAQTIGELCLSQNIDVMSKLSELLDDALVGESDFPVSALIETEQGYFSGVNIEFSSWNMGLCAERIAIAKALTYGSSNIKALHINTRKGEFSSPCGACRQVIIEHLPHQQIHLHHANGSESVHFGNDLLPFSFRSSSLSK
jgi:homotetrameric cytidine deaminase